MSSATSSVAAALPLKWAGGKRRIASEIVSRLPSEISTYYEPFVGGGAVFFRLVAERGPLRAVLADSNRALIDTYTVIRDETEALIEHLSAEAQRYMDCTASGRSDMYYRIRAEFNQVAALDAPSDRIEVAWRFMWLNRTSYNGLFRRNASGFFNVPHGSYESPRIVDPPALRAAATALSTADLRAGDFAETLAACEAGSAIYADPPYLARSRSAAFTAYTPGGFDMTEQQRLCSTLADLAARSVAVVASNSAHPDIEDLYREEGFRVEEVNVRHMIAASGPARIPLREYIITSQ